MDSTQNCTVDVQKLLHPELLSRSELLEILLSRCVQQQLLEGLEKYQLVDLFQRIVMPLPQRTYNNKRRGKMLNELRSKKERQLNCAENKASVVNRSDTLEVSSVGDGQVEHGKMASRCSKNSLDHIIVNDRRKMAKIEIDPSETTDDAKNKPNMSVRLKRSDANSSERSSTSSTDEDDDKKKRRRIVWP